MLVEMLIEMFEFLTFIASVEISAPMKGDQDIIEKVAMKKRQNRK